MVQLGLVQQYMLQFFLVSIRAVVLQQPRATSASNEAGLTIAHEQQQYSSPAALNSTCGFIDGLQVSPVTCSEGSSTCVYASTVGWVGCCGVYGCNGANTKCIEVNATVSDVTSAGNLTLLCGTSGFNFLASVCRKYTWPQLNASSFRCVATSDPGPITVETLYPEQSATISFDVSRDITRTAAGAGRTQTYTICIGNGCGFVGGGSVGVSGGVAGLSTGAIVGVVIGCIVGALLLGSCIWPCVKPCLKRAPSRPSPGSESQNTQAQAVTYVNQPASPVTTASPNIRAPTVAYVNQSAPTITTARWTARSRPGLIRVDDNGRPLRD